MSLRPLSVIQCALLVALTGTAVYAFSQSAVYWLLDETLYGFPGPQHLGLKVFLVLAAAGAGALSVVRRDWLPGAAAVLMLLLLSWAIPTWAGLGALCFLLGVYLVVRRGLVWVFLGLLGILHLPSLMAFSLADWLWFVPGFEWETRLTLGPMMVLGGWLIAGTLFLHYVTQARESGLAMLSQGYEPDAVKGWYLSKLGFAFTILGAATLATTAVMGSATGLDLLLGGSVAGIPYATVIFGVGGSAVLIAGIYYVLAGRRPRTGK